MMDLLLIGHLPCFIQPLRIICAWGIGGTRKRDGSLARQARRDALIHRPQKQGTGHAQADAPARMARALPLPGSLYTIDGIISRVI